MRAIIILATVLAAGCAGVPSQRPPLWDAEAYPIAAVLPIRMVIKTGVPPFTSDNTDLSNEMGAVIHQALSAVMVYRGYEVLAPLDIEERLGKDRKLSEAFMDLAMSAGIAPGGSPPGYSSGGSLKSAETVASALGADLLVLAYGDGEYHSAGESIIQGLLTGMITKGERQYREPPSYLSVHMIFVDPGLDRPIAGLYSGRMPFIKDPVRLARALDDRTKRIPTFHLTPARHTKNVTR